MTEGSTDRVTMRDVLDAVNRLEDKVSMRLTQQDGRLDAAVSRLDRIEGAVGLVKWLGPAGLAAVVGGLLLAFGSALVK